jgi:putative ABC transport system ATP-binding protein
MSLDSLRAQASALDRLRHVQAPARGSRLGHEQRARRDLATVRTAQRATRAGDRTASRTANEGDRMSPVIRTTGVTKRYTLGKNNAVVALRGASVEIESGEMVAIVGPSGSGKSTLMHLVGCLDTPDSGRVFINGRRVDNLKGSALTRVRSTEIGFIFQGFNLVPTMNALDNVALAAEYAGVPRRQAVDRAEELLDLVGLGDRTRHLPSELSGGQQQRVAIARALVNSPTIVLGDEPTGDLDTTTSDEIVAVMRKINVDTGTTFVLVTHNPEVAAACDRTISMRDGVVADDGLDAEPAASSEQPRTVLDTVFALSPTAACC